MRSAKKHPRPARRSRLGLEQLEPREVPATLAPLNDFTTPNTKDLYLPLTVTNATGTVTYSAASSNPQVQVQVVTGGTTIKLRVAGTAAGGAAFEGDLTFRLFDTLAPATTARIVALVNQGFYDDLTFHRIIDGFVAQGGDPNGNGTGGSGLKIDDEFTTRLTFNSPGLLAMANSGDDTGDSQFFITDTDLTLGQQPQNLNFQHTIFGQLVAGFDTFAKLMSTPVQSSDTGTPLSPVTITAATVVPNDPNGVLRVTAPATFTGTSAVTVTPSDGGASSTGDTFNVNFVADAVNDAPFLGPVAGQTTTPGTAATFQLTATDLEGDALTYSVVSATTTGGQTVNVQTQIDQATGRVTVTPPANFTGPISLKFGVKDASHTTPDTQVVTLNVTSATAAVSTVTSTTANGTYGVGATINVTLTFSQPVTLAGGNLTLALSGGGTVTFAPFTNQTTVTGTYTVAAGHNSGDLDSTALALATGATLRDAGGTAVPLAIPSGQSLAKSKALVVDTAAPTVTIGAPSSAATGRGVVTYTVTYADPNFNTSTLTAANVTLNKTGTANGTVTVTGSGKTRTVTISNITGNGTLGISIAASTATDKANQSAPAAGPSATVAVKNSPLMAVGGSDGTVRTLNPTTGAVVSTVRPLDTKAGPYRGVVQVAFGDFNGDAVPDLFVTAADAGGVNGLAATKAGKVFVFDGTAAAKGTLSHLHTFTPFANHAGPGQQKGTTDRTGAYTNGLNIAVGDVNGDGKIDLVAGTRVGPQAARLEYGRLVVVTPGGTKNGAADTFVGSDKLGHTPFGPAYAKGVVVAVGDLDGAPGDEIAVTRGDAVAVTNPNKTLKLKAFDLNAAGTALAELRLSGTNAPLAPFAGVGSGTKIIDGGGRVTFTDANGDGKDELVFAALDAVTDASNARVRVAAFAVNTATGLATATSTGAGPSKSYLAGKGVTVAAIAGVSPGAGGTRNLVLVTRGASSGVQFLAPLSGTPLAGGFNLNVLNGGISLEGV